MSFYKSLYFTFLWAIMINNCLTEEVIKTESDSTEINLSVVACGDRLEETLIMIKSALLFSHSVIHVHIFADKDLKPIFDKRLRLYPQYPNQLRFSLYDIQFPKDKSEEWKRLFKPCACQRLFIPNIVKVDKLIYVDTDILFLRPLDDLWAFFGKFNSTQIAAVTPEHEESWMGWYNRFARHPYYPPLGVNSGVMLMDLKGLRAADWQNKMIEYFEIYRWNTTWGDQDLINIFFHFYPEKLYIYSCDWNYRSDHCMYGSTCKPAEKYGASILHGSRSSFHNDKQPAFKAVYDAIKDYEYGSDMMVNILGAVKRNFAPIVTEQWKKCIEYPDQFTKQLKKQIEIKMAAEKKARIEL